MIDLGSVIRAFKSSLKRYANENNPVNWWLKQAQPPISSL